MIITFLFKQIRVLNLFIQSYVKVNKYLISFIHQCREKSIICMNVKKDFRIFVKVSILGSNDLKKVFFYKLSVRCMCTCVPILMKFGIRFRRIISLALLGRFRRNIPIVAVPKLEFPEDFSYFLRS